MIGTGVNGSGITTWAAKAVSRANPATSPMLTARERGRTTAVITGDGTVVCTIVSLPTPAGREVYRAW